MSSDLSVAATLAQIDAFNGDASKASRALGVPRSTLRARWARARAQRAEQPRRIATSADEAWRALDHWIGRAHRVIETPARTPSARERIIVASDFHAPFHAPEFVAEMIATESKTADVLIVNGDLQDFYSISRFTKYESIPIEQELAAVDALLGQLSHAFPRVVVVTGNHDRPRFEKQLRAMLPLEMVHIVEYLAGGSLDVIAAMAKRYPNVEIARHEVGEFSLRWFYQHGDLICAHAEKFSRVPGAALRGVHEWFSDRAATIGLKPWRVLIQAHTHQLGLFPWLSDQLLVEGGCLCNTHGYQLDARIMGRPQRRGYVSLEQVDGVTDANSVRLHWLDASSKR